MSRVHHPDCRVVVSAFGDRADFECDDAEVWIESDSILVSYFDDEGMVVLEGRGSPSKGWELKARSRPRQAALALDAAQPGAYHGRVEEHGEEGQWSLLLGAPAAETATE